MLSAEIGIRIVGLCMTIWFFLWAKGRMGDDVSNSFHKKEKTIGGYIGLLLLSSLGVLILLTGFSTIDDGIPAWGNPIAIVVIMGVEHLIMTYLVDFSNLRRK